MRVILKISFAAILVILFSSGASNGNSLFQRGDSLAKMSAPESVISQPQTEEPRGSNVFIWYCCNGVRFHSVTISQGQTLLTELYWGVNYQSVSLRQPNCRNGKLTIMLASQAMVMAAKGSYHIYSYGVTGELLHGATMADCDVIADLFSSGQLINSQDFRVYIQP
jgi:hypothetical protein